MKELHFSAGLLEPILIGEKETTLRRYDENHSFKKGENTCGVFEEGVRMLLEIKEDTQTKMFANLTDREAQESGFRDAHHALEGLQRYYESLTPEEMCAIVRFQLMQNFNGIPYERQKYSTSCGAAALSMVYQSFGLTVDQEDIWDSVRGTKNGVVLCKKRKMCRDALHRGLHALLVRIREEYSRISLLYRMRSNTSRFIPLLPTEHGTHSVVYAGLQHSDIVFHDPDLAPSRLEHFDTFMGAWRRWGPKGRSGLLMGIAPHKEDSACTTCGTIIPASIVCSQKHCQKEIQLQPTSIVGCIREECSNAVWDAIECPHCGRWGKRRS